MSSIRFDRRDVLRAALLLALGGGLAACGVKGSPEAPAGERAAYPRSYPSPNRYPARTEEAEEEQQRIDPATGEPLDREDVETVEEEDDI